MLTTMITILAPNFRVKLITPRRHQTTSICGKVSAS